MHNSDVNRPPRPSALMRAGDILAELEGRRLIVFLDYDGTITPIVERPELATLDEEMRTTLRRLAASATVAVISGRSCADVKRLVGLENVYYAGNHGFEIVGPRGTAIRQEFALDYLDDVRLARELLGKKLRGIENMVLEDKRFSLSVHYRLVDSLEVATIRRAVDAVVAQLPRIQKRSGKKVFELRPRIDWHKGKIVLWLLRKLGLDNDLTIPIYIGDDVTDEDAFLALQNRGIGIVVGEPADSAASYTLHDPVEVKEFLKIIIARQG